MTTSPLRSIQSRWWVVALFAALGALLGYLPAPTEIEAQATSYEATHTMLANEGGDASIISPTQVVLLATVGEVPRRVASEIGYSGNSAELAAGVDVQFDFDTGALTFTTSQPTAAQAEMIADTFAAQLSAYLTERQSTVYQERLAASRLQLAEFEQQLNDLTAELAAAPEDPVLLAERDAVSRQYGLAFEQNGQLEQDPGQLVFTTLETAQAIPIVDAGLSAPTSRTARAAMGLVVGGALGVGVALFLGRVDRKVRSREQVEDLVGMRARVAIPRDKRTQGGVVVSTGRHDPLSDAYRTVRNVVGFVQGGLEPTARGRVTLVVSPGPGDGKTSLTANLAAAFVEMGQRTIAVNTDFRRPRLHEAILGTPPPEMPFDMGELEDLPRRALPLDTTVDGLKILDLSNLPGSPGQRVRATISQLDRLSDLADQIVIDTSPIGATAEVLDLVPIADVIVMVANVGHTAIDAVERTVAILHDIGKAPIVFVVGGIKVGRNHYHEYTDRRPDPVVPAENGAMLAPRPASE